MSKSKWTAFMDMHSGGGTKEKKYEYIFIEAPENEAKIIFYNKFGHNPERVSCTCCGEDYSISEYDSLEQATGYERNCDYDNKNKKYIERPRSGYSGLISLAEYVKMKDVLIVYSKDIRENERIGEVPEQGYVWH